MSTSGLNFAAILCAALGVAVLGCATADSEGAAGAGGGAGGVSGRNAENVLVTSGYVASTFGFFYPESLESEFPGFDLDQRVSSAESPGTNECAHDDFAGPSGELGIDYNFLRLIHDDEKREDEKYVFGGFHEGQLVDGVINGAVKNGSMTVLLDIQGVDDPQNDDEVTVRVFGSEDSPTKGNDEVLPYATLSIHPDPQFHTELVTGSIVDGVLTAGPFDLTFPINIQIVEGEFVVHDSWLRIELGDDSFQGLIAGFWDVSNIRDIIGKPTTDNGNAANFTIEQFEAAMALYADGDYDAIAGSCTSFTTMFTFSGVQAFIARAGGGSGEGGAGGSGNIGLLTPTDQCTNEADREALDAIATEEQTGLDVVGQLTGPCTTGSCIAEVLSFLGEPSNAALRAISDCVALCISGATGLSAGCAGCYGLTAACGGGVCYDQCIADQGSQECIDCALACTDLGACTGL